MADLSIVVPSFQQGRYLERCLASIRAQEGVDIELIVIDAESADETPEVLERWRPRIDHLVVEPDDGQADAIRKGFEAASAPVLAWLNADDAYAGPAAVQTLVTALARQPDMDAAYGRRVWIDGAGGFLRLDRWMPFDGELLRRSCYLPQECTIFRRSAYERVGGIDPTFSFALDYDLWLRLLDSGSRFVSLPPVVGLFRVHADQKTTARWADVGLVEIGRLHRRHLGHTIPETAMIEAAERHRNGVPPGAEAPVEQLLDDVTGILNGHLANLLRGRTLDGWAPAA